MTNVTDPTWLDRAVAALPSWFFRAAGAACFGVFLAHRWSTRSGYPNQALFWLEAAIPAMILAAYLTRSEPKRRARGTTAILLPFVGAALPLGLQTSPPTAFGLEHQSVILITLCVPTALMIWAYMNLNRSFAIMAEAREMKTGGPYRFVRHPVYASQILCGAVVLVWRFSPWGLACWLTFIWVQTTRARAEEAALLEAHPEYACYMETTPGFLPRAR